MITVYGAPPTRSMRVVWMLEEMELEYQIHAVDFAKRTEDVEFIQASPTGSFPGFRDGDVCLMESCAILEYLGAKYGPTSLVPTLNDAQYPRYLSFLHFGEASLSGPLNVTIGTRFFAPDEHKQNWGAQFAIDNFIRKSAAMLEPLRRGPFLAGDTFTAADISCGYALGLAHFLGFAERLDPALREYLGRLAQRPAYRAANAHQRPTPT
ncbi:MAG: glutathione S-transferase family protein [Pseudomonadota bacterium]|nr:glutathione S-transferase family protein [Pseudomonadota bacterium]